MRATLNINSPSFGYDAKYHKQLQEKLLSRKDFPSLAKKLVEMDNFALSLEDEVIQLEQKRKTKTELYDYMTDLLVTSRDAFAKMMQYAFPRLEYAKNESKIYEEEAQGDKMHGNAQLWRDVLADEIEKYCPVKQEEFLGNVEPVKSAFIDARKQNDKKGDKESKSSDIPLYAPPFANPFVTQIQPPISQSQNTEEENGANLVVKYVAGEFSPKGFSSVVDMDDLKEKFKSDIIDYAQNPELEKLDFEEYGIRAPRGYLFYGPPGCGKTYIIQALAAESGLDMYKLDLSKIGTKYVNQTQKNVQSVFDKLAQEHEKTGKKILLFMDEVDSIGSKRRFSETSNREDDKVVAALLKCIDEARNNGIVVIAATNRYDGLDEAFKSRFDFEKYIGLPSEKTIAQLIKFELSKKKKGQSLASCDDEINNIAKQLVGYSNRSVVFIVDEAAKIAKNDNRSDIKAEHILKALNEREYVKSEEKDYHKNSSKQKSIVGFGAF